MGVAGDDLRAKQAVVSLLDELGLDDVERTHSTTPGVGGVRPCTPA